MINDSSISNIFRFERRTPLIPSLSHDLDHRGTVRWKNQSQQSPDRLSIHGLGSHAGQSTSIWSTKRVQEYIHFHQMRTHMPCQYWSLHRLLAQFSQSQSPLIMLPPVIASAVVDTLSLL